ncbi:hypothetical protein B0T14DRAFT_519296 [Immersiella caudata]|uniref:Uncharacterized protein n=1 Tax=Immersiella caudata TaxID=314043 RepID=A0AA39WQ34_9PEZI|nr:hypothetical protein B0T14DRAFT_519296 [Immersiella caudata]
MPRHFPPHNSQDSESSAFPKATGLPLRAGCPIAGQPDSATVAYLYRLSKLARVKLYQEVTFPDRNLLRIVGHANLLDDVLQRLDDADVDSQDSWCCSDSDGEEEEEETDFGDVGVGEVEEIEVGDGDGLDYYPHLRGESDSDSESDSESDKESDDSEDWEDFKGEEDGDSSGEESVNQCPCCEDGNAGGEQKSRVKVVDSAAGDETETSSRLQTGDFPVCIEKLVDAVDAMSAEVRPRPSGFRNGCLVQFLGPPSWW